MNRDDFPMLNQDIIYFDNGATTFKPYSVINSVKDYYENYSANAHRGDYDISYKVDLAFENVREDVRKFINAKEKEEIIFTSGTTMSMNIMVQTFFKKYLEHGDEVLITQTEHASNVLPWFNLANEIGINVKYIDLDQDYHVTIDNVLKAITPNTKVISLAYITNVIGDVRPIKEICKLAHERNIFVCVDAAQAAAHTKIDVQNLDVDFLALSAHKMYGPTGIGVLYGKKELLNEASPYMLGGGMNESFDSVNEIVLKDLPYKFEAGTQNIAGVIGLGAAIKYINNIGLDNISLYELNLRKYLINKLEKIPYIDIINYDADSAIVSINVDNIFPQDIAYYLNKYNVCVRAGNHCAKLVKNVTGVNNSVRLSLAFYNTEEEIDEVANLLSDLNKIKEEMI
ncbi:MAG: cysteine desulfurase [Bacilli bacterium]|nr:cysteine desulfurase [Bacilli bacterium]